MQIFFYKFSYNNIISNIKNFIKIVFIYKNWQKSIMPIGIKYDIDFNYK